MHNTRKKKPEQDGTDDAETEGIRAVAIAEDDSVILAGGTPGNVSGTSAGPSDFYAVMLDSEGEELWRWQVSFM